MIDKLTLRDKAILAILALVAVGYVLYTYIHIPVSENIDSLNQEIAVLKGKDFTHLDEKLTAIEAENTADLMKINGIKAQETGRSFDPRMFLIFLSDQCDKSGAKLVKFNDLGQTEKDGVWKQKYDFELRGRIANINKICGSLEDLDVKYSVGGMSLRQNNDYPFLERFFDGISKLEWYTDPDPKQEDEKVEQEEDFNPFFQYELFPETQWQTPLPEATPGASPSPQASPTPTPEATPEPTPEPSAEPTPEPTAESEPAPDYLEESTEGLFDESSIQTISYTPRIMLVNTYEYGDVLRLNITIEFTMYADPATGGAIKNEIL